MHKVDNFIIKSLHRVYSKNKNAFQWDAYRPLVDRIPAYTVQGAYLNRGGVPAWGIPAAGCLPGVCVSQHAMGQTSTLWKDRHL